MRYFPYLTGALLTIFCTSCIASARVETAVVIDIDGLPCFSVPEMSETHKGIPLYMLEVSRLPAPDEKLAERVWYFNVGPAQTSMVAMPGKCFRYGATPKVAEQTELKPLQPYHIYIVDIKAKHPGTNLRGFQAEFCMKPAANGKFRVLPIPWDDKANRRNYQVCAKL